MKPRTRFAPSPTGALHMGSVRTALFNYLFARGRGGTFILRMEDTDRARSRPEFERSIMEDLRWLGLLWDEGPESKDAPLGPYRQSERGGIYERYAGELLDKGLAYRCYCTKERLAELKEAQARKGLPPRYDGKCRDAGLRHTKDASSVRFRVPEKKEISFNDLLHGPRVFNASALGDFIIMTPAGQATYNFAAAVDDGLMEITHVIRGDDHLSNTPAQVLIMEALGMRVPEYAHIPLVLGPDRKPLGKRDKGAGIKELRLEGFLPIAIINTAARLGWAPGPLLMGLEDLASAFSPERLSKSPSIFEPHALLALNKEAMNELSADELIRPSGLHALSDNKEALIEAVEAVRANAETLKDLERLAGGLVKRPAMTTDAEDILKTEEARAILKAFLHELDKGVTSYEELVKNVKKKTRASGRTLFMGLRCALTGETKGIELKKIFEVLGPRETAERIREIL